MEGTMEAVEEVVIIGAGLSGLATALGLHRKGIKSLVLESSASLRASGFAFRMWTNGWKALDALAVGDALRTHHLRLQLGTTWSASPGARASQLSFTSHGECGEHEVRCVKRDLLLETLEKELPKGTIRYSSRLVSIDEAGGLKLLHLADGSLVKTKVLVGCDGVNSLVAKWLGLKKPSLAGRSASRGFATYPDGHGFKPEFAHYLGQGFQFGLMPCDEHDVYWFFACTPTQHEKGVDQEDETKTRQFVLSKLRTHSGVPEAVLEVIERSQEGSVLSSPLRFRWPFELIWGNISKGNVCVAGDALHPMTPDLGQGGSSALEDGVVLARCLGDALLDGENGRTKDGLIKYSRGRRWRGFRLIATAYLLGCMQESHGWLMSFVRDKLLSGLVANAYLKNADFDCGRLV